MTSPICRVCGNIEEYDHHDPIDKCQLFHPFDPMPERVEFKAIPEGYADKILGKISAREHNHSVPCMICESTKNNMDAEIKELKERLEKAVNGFEEIIASGIYLLDGWDAQNHEDDCHKCQIASKTLKEIRK